MTIMLKQATVKYQKGGIKPTRRTVFNNFVFVKFNILFIDEMHPF